MWFLTLLCYLAIAVQIVFCTISIAAGLYYIAELVEEYTTFAKKVIWWLNTAVLSTYVMLWVVENFPLTMIIYGILAQICHFLILRNFPLITFLSFNFLTSIILMVINHYLAFTYFLAVYHSFTEVITYFTICLWIVPFALFVSLSANDNILPTVDQKDDIVSNYFSKRNKKYGLLSFFQYAKETVLPVKTKKGF